MSHTYRILALIVAAVFVGATFASGLRAIATVKSSVLPADVVGDGLTVSCTWQGPFGTGTTRPPIGFGTQNRYCWVGFVLYPGVYSIEATNLTTGASVFGADTVPGAECTGGSLPACTIELTAKK